MNAQSLFAPGATVKLTPEARASHRCPKGRQNNRTAKLFRQIGETTYPGGWGMDRDLAGCLYWNESELIVVKGA